MATSVVTGANRGIGLELCRQLAARGDTIVAVCRTASAELHGVRGVRIESGVDVASDQAMAALGERLRSTRVDLLIANAGILREDSLEALDLGSVREQLEVNALGPLRTVSALLDSLQPGAKIGLITSRMGSIADNGSGGYYGYRMSKAALNAAGMSLAHDLKSRSIAVAILHPGYVRTDMTDHEGMLEPSESARLLLARLDELTLKTSGTFWHANGERLPW
jgi:NAD(P)-dependent dehydrogenase (short-subunit alcohol dehydrogenase family)